MCEISLCMIVKNEEDTLGNCLHSVRGIADEIVIADTGSTDRTREVAKEFGGLVFEFPWVDDFSAARNFSFSKAEKDYILWLDADDVLLPEDRKKLLALKKSLDPSVDVYMMKYNIGTGSESGGAALSYYRERLVKRSRGFRWREPVHEYLETGGKIVNTDICVTHAGGKKEKSGRNLRIYENLLSGGGSLSPRGLYYYGRELKENGRFSEAAEAFREFLDGGEGWVEDNISACMELAECLRKTGGGDMELPVLLRSFAYDAPRPETCCQIGYCFERKGEYCIAAFWFGLCLSLREPEEKWGFRIPDCHGYVPCIECAVCYDRLGEFDRAEAYNERAARYKPDSPSVLHNREYFKSKKIRKGTEKSTVRAEKG
jgi:glycosyltransferase involved in cell wall biosynthesis